MLQRPWGRLDWVEGTQSTCEQCVAQQGTLLSNVAWSFAFARALLGRRMVRAEGIELAMREIGARQADDEELLAALRCQLRELGAKVDAQTPLEVPARDPSQSKSKTSGR